MALCWAGDRQVASRCSIYGELVYIHGEQVPGVDQVQAVDHNGLDDNVLEHGVGLEHVSHDGLVVPGLSSDQALGTGGLAGHYVAFRMMLDLLLGLMCSI